MKTLEIDLNKWGKSYLRGPFGKMCCLGFCAKTLGATNPNINDLQSPQEIPELKWPTFLLRNALNTDTAAVLMTINDSTTLPRALRMALIKRVFGRHGVLVKFTHVPESTERDFKKYSKLNTQRIVDLSRSLETDLNCHSFARELGDY